MSTITTINSTDPLEPDSRGKINTNFSNLNSDKAEKSANLSDLVSKSSALNNLLPDQTGNANKLLKTDGAGTTSWSDPTTVADASTTTKGITKVSVAPASSSNPISVGDNDPRVPTQDENDALAGTGTPSASNPYTTADTDALKELLANKDTTTTLGTSDTKYPSQKAVKTYVDTQDGLRALANPLGSWSDVSANADGNPHQVSTDGFLIIDCPNNANIQVLTDSSNPPTTERMFITGTISGGAQGGCCPVRKNDYYKLVKNGSPTVYWIPLGT